MYWSFRKQIEEDSSWFYSESIRHGKRRRSFWKHEGNNVNFWLKISDHIIKSIEEEKLNEEIVLSIEERLNAVQNRKVDMINNNNLKIILMTLLSILKKNEIKMRKSSSSTLKKEKVNILLKQGYKFIFITK
jgi:hypothetical protein